MTEVILYALAQCCRLEAGGLLVVDSDRVDLEDLIGALQGMRPGRLAIVRAWDVEAVRYVPLFYPLPSVVKE